jgi:serine/threonine protein kinase
MKECIICKRVFGDHIDRCDYDESPLRNTLPGSPIVTSNINRYRLDERFGQGSLGIVYKGASVGSQAPLIIKMIHPAIAGIKEVRKILLEQADALGTIKHPYIVPILDYGYSANGSVFFVTEYLEGLTLQQLLEQKLVLPFPRIATLLNQLCSAMQTAHQANLLHHDLKPSNIFIAQQTNSDQLKILDFGIAKIKTPEICAQLPSALTQTLFSLPYYFSPEQCEGAALTAQAEVYSLGIIAYQLLTGHLPFSGMTFIAVMNQHLMQPPPPLRSLRAEIPEVVESVILRSLAKSPQDRYQSAAEFAQSLDWAMETSGLLRKSLGFGSSGNITATDSGTLTRNRSTTRTPRLSNASPEDILVYIARLLDNTIKSSSYLTLKDLYPDDLVKQLAEQFEKKSVHKDQDIFIPSLVNIYLPRTTPEKLRELESIINSVIFVNNIYQYIRKKGYRLANLLKIELEVADPRFPISQCVVLANWPAEKDISNGLEEYVRIEKRQITDRLFPAIEIPKVALLQTINAPAYSDMYLVVRRSTYLGRFRNVIDHEDGQIIRRNDVSFLQSPQPESPNNTVSRQHAQIEFINGDFYLFDNVSTNGTKINRLTKGERQEIVLEPGAAEGIKLHHRDTIQLGIALLSFELIATEQIPDLVERLPLEHSLRVTLPGSTADIFHTVHVTSSMQNLLAW